MDYNLPFEDFLRQMKDVRQVSPRFTLGQGLHAANAWLFQKGHALIDEVLPQGALGRKAPALAIKAHHLFTDAVIRSEGLGSLLDQWEKTNDRLEKISEIDKKFLKHFFKKGFLSSTPRVNNAIKTITSPPTSVLSGVEGWGSIAVGNNYRFLPNELEEKKDNLGNGLHKEASSTQKLASYNDWDRWIILLHEAAHAEHHQQKILFSPSAGMLSRDSQEEAAVVHAINTWVMHVSLGPARSRSSQANLWIARTVDEAFADVYAAMMILQQSNWHPDALTTVERQSATRKKAREMEQCNISAATPFTTHYAGCDIAVDLALKNKEEWKDLSAKELKKKALEFASDAFLIYANPHPYQDNLGRSSAIPLTILRDMVPAHDVVLASAIGPHVWHELAAPHDTSCFEKIYGDHPLRDVFRQAIDVALEDIRNKFDTPKKAQEHFAHFFSSFGSPQEKQKDYNMVSEALMSLPPFSVLSSPYPSEEAKMSFKKDRALVEKVVDDILEKGFPKLSNQSLSKNPAPLSVKTFAKNRSLSNNQLPSPQGKSYV